MQEDPVVHGHRGARVPSVIGRMLPEFSRQLIRRLFGLRYQNVDFVWTVLSFGWCESPYVYHSLSEVKAAFLRAKAIPALAYIDDSWLANVQSTHGQSARS